MVISTGMMLPRCDSVAALYCLQKSMMLTPCGPRAVPTGGAGVAAPAFSCTLTTATIFFLLGAISSGFLVSDLAYLIERQLDRCFAAEDRHEHLELLGVGVNLAHGRRKRRERPVHNGNGLADLEVHGRRARGLRLLRNLLLGLGCEQRRHLVEAERRRPAGQADEAGNPRRVAHRGP